LCFKRSRNILCTKYIAWLKTQGVKLNGTPEDRELFYKLQDEGKTEWAITQPKKKSKTLVEKRILEPCGKPETYKERMGVSVSRMSEAVFETLQQEGIPVMMEQEFCVLATKPDLYFPAHDLAVYLDGPPHLKREERDVELRRLLQKRYGFRILELSYETFTNKALNQILSTIREALT